MLKFNHSSGLPEPDNKNKNYSEYQIPACVGISCISTYLYLIHISTNPLYFVGTRLLKCYSETEWWEEINSERTLIHYGEFLEHYFFRKFCRPPKELFRLGSDFLFVRKPSWLIKGTFFKSLNQCKLDQRKCVKLALFHGYGFHMNLCLLLKRGTCNED